MRSTFFLIILASFCTVLAANDIAVSARDGVSGWMLLEEPFGPGGDGLSDYAGDPGMPAPDAMNWPHRAGQSSNGTYPTTELWFYDAIARDFRRATNVLGAGDEKRNAFRRTLYSLVAVGDDVYALHFDPYKTLGGYAQLIKIDETLAGTGGVIPASSIVLNSAEFIDAPAASPDGKHIVMRAFTRGENGFNVTLRVFSTDRWKLIAETDVQTFARPVWINNSTIGVIAYNAGILPTAPQRDPSRKFSIGLLDSHKPQPGALIRLDLANGKLAATELFKGSFPPDNYTRTLLADPFGLGLVVAHLDGKEVVVELREPEIDGEATEIARYARFRGMALSLSRVRSAGVIKLDRTDTLHIYDYIRWGEVRVPMPDRDDVVIPLPLGDRSYLNEVPLPSLSIDGHGGLLDLGRGVIAMLEPVTNPGFEPKKNEDAQLLRHTINVLSWPGCDTMRNPRALAYLSKLVRRFKDVGTVKSSLLAYDIELTNAGNKKSGRYIELYGNAGRAGKGRIRMEDNLSGSWLVQAIDGKGMKDGDKYYSETNINTPTLNARGEMDSQPAKDAGKVYDDLVTQLDTRKLLMLSDVDASLGEGGLFYRGRQDYRDPVSGTTWRVWVYERYGRELKDGGRERAELRFVADLPIGSAGDWNYPHAIARARVRFAMANARGTAITDLAFEPDEWVALPNLVDLENGERNPRPELLMPKTFRIFQPDDKGKPEEQLRATAIEGEFDHPRQLVSTGKLRAGYNVPGVVFGPDQFIELKR